MSSLYFLFQKMQRRVIGFCGGIGSGKSTRLKHVVAWCGRNTGAAPGAAFPHVHIAHSDADVVAHRCYEPGSPTYAKVVAAFGSDILCTADAAGESPSAAAPTPAPTPGAAAPAIDRRRLGAKVFGTGRMPELNAIVWPAIAQQLQRDIDAAAAQAAAAARAAAGDAGRGGGGEHTLVYLVEAAILPHMRAMLDMCDEVWLFHASEDAAVARVVQRNGVTPEEALKRVRSQSTVDEKRALVADAGRALRFFDTTRAETDEQLALGLQEVVSSFEQMLLTSLSARNAGAPPSQ